MNKRFSRRDFLSKAGRAVSVAAGAVLLTGSSNVFAAPTPLRQLAAGMDAELEMWLLATGHGKIDEVVFTSARHHLEEMGIAAGTDEIVRD